MSLLDEASKSPKHGDMFTATPPSRSTTPTAFRSTSPRMRWKSRGIGVDIASFTDALEEQKKKARASWAGSGEAATEAIWFPLREKLGATEFLGYDTERAEGVVTAPVRDGKEVAERKPARAGRRC